MMLHEDGSSDNATERVQLGKYEMSLCYRRFGRREQRAVQGREQCNVIERAFLQPTLSSILQTDFENPNVEHILASPD